MHGKVAPPAWPPRPNLDRLIEDLNATTPLLNECAARGRPLHPSMATLALLGRRFLADDRQDASAAALRARPWVLDPLVTRPNLTVLDGTVRLSYFLAAVAYGAEAAQASAIRDNGWDWEAGLQWLVLHGVATHRLWSFLPSWFVSDLLRPSLRRAGQSLSPLQLLLLRECPKLAADLPRPGSPTFAGQLFAAQFNAWLATEGLARFGLFWLLSRTEFPADPSASAAAERDLPADLIWPPPDPPAASPTAAAALARGARLAASQLDLGPYGGFGPGFPALRVAIEQAAPGPGSPWRPDPAAALRARLDADAWAELIDTEGLDPITAEDSRPLDLAATHGSLSLPAGCLPPSVLLLDLEIAPALQDLVWLRVVLDDQTVALRPASDFRPGRPQLLALPHGTATGAPLLELRLGCRPATFATVAQAGGRFARLHGLHVWRLR